MHPELENLLGHDAESHTPEHRLMSFTELDQYLLDEWCR